ncbi:MAG: type II toxin-antitoxin system VapC family toxin [Desulfobacterales bacterium]|jgi:predicted nucleic acid-binding protein|nr:type II toxin-antitoxin system VapC family toxin [Desulfobacterales bacterium]
MNIVDSSGWLEYFSGGINSENFASPLQDPSSLIVPVITIYEVFKVALRESGENEALQAVAAMQQGTIIDLTASIAINASKLSLRYSLPIADSIILSTAQAYECLIWTQDSDFENLPGVKFFPKTKVGPTTT